MKLEVRFACEKGKDGRGVLREAEGMGKIKLILRSFCVFRLRNLERESLGNKQGVEIISDNPRTTLLIFEIDLRILHARIRTPS